MTACAIMQPSYMPWPGYFNLMATADVFVVLDDAQFQRSSWHCRNQIIVGGVATFLTVPVLRTGIDTKLCDAQINYRRDWRKSHAGQIRQAYSRTPGGALIVDALESVWLSRPDRLIDLNLAIIDTLVDVLRIDTPRVLASRLGVTGERSERLLGICEHLGVEDYLSPAGSAEYLEADGFALAGTVALHLQNFVPEPYLQRETETFIPYMSIVDVIANIGPDLAADYIRQPAFPHYVKE
jgi:hypothetical protein